MSLTITNETTAMLRAVTQTPRGHRLALRADGYQLEAKVIDRERSREDLECLVGTKIHVASTLEVPALAGTTAEAFQLGDLVVTGLRQVSDPVLWRRRDTVQGRVASSFDGTQRGIYIGPDATLIDTALLFPTWQLSEPNRTRLEKSRIGNVMRWFRQDEIFRGRHGPDARQEEEVRVMGLGDYLMSGQAAWQAA